MRNQQTHSSQLNTPKKMRGFLSVLLLLSALITTAQNDGWPMSTTTNTDYTGMVVTNRPIGIFLPKNPLKLRTLF